MPTKLLKKEIKPDAARRSRSVVGSPWVEYGYVVHLNGVD